METKDQWNVQKFQRKEPSKKVYWKELLLNGNWESWKHRDTEDSRLNTVFKFLWNFSLYLTRIIPWVNPFEFLLLLSNIWKINNFLWTQLKPLYSVFKKTKKLRTFLCCSGKLYEECWWAVSSKNRVSKTAEELMRFVYAAFAIPNGIIYGKPHCPAKENSMTKVNWKFGEKKTLGQTWNQFQRKEVEFSMHR